MLEGTEGDCQRGYQVTRWSLDAIRKWCNKLTALAAPIYLDVLTITTKKQNHPITVTVGKKSTTTKNSTLSLLYVGILCGNTINHLCEILQEYLVWALGKNIKWRSDGGRETDTAILR
jgi:hypothetical protein